MGNSYTEDQLMHTFLDNLQQGGKYCAHISICQADFRREERLIDKKYYLYLTYKLII